MKELMKLGNKSLRLGKAIQKAKSAGGVKRTSMPRKRTSKAKRKLGMSGIKFEY